MKANKKKQARKCLILSNYWRRKTKNPIKKGGRKTLYL